MSVKNLTNISLLASVLLLLGFPSFVAAQTSKLTLEAYLSQTLSETQKADSATIAEWTATHPGETVDIPEESYAQGTQWSLNTREQQNRKLEGRWCLRSTAEIALDGGALHGDIKVRRIALFYPPLVEESAGQPLPPLPTESGSALREHGCRLVKILSEFELNTNEKDFAEAVASQLSGDRYAEPGKFLEYPKKGDYWTPLYSFKKIGSGLSYNYLYTRNASTKDDDGAVVLLESEWGTLDYGNPSPKTVNPLAPLPWLPLRAAMLAKLPSAPTLAMLSFLAPRAGDPLEQPPLHCERQLVPVLRTWLNLATRSAPEQHAAALLLADMVLQRLPSCEEFTDADADPERQRDRDALMKDLKALGIETDTGNYAGNLRDKALKLAPNGAVNELGHLAVLNNRCQWSSDAQAADCPNIIWKAKILCRAFLGVNGPPAYISFWRRLRPYLRKPGRQLCNAKARSGATGEQSRGALPRLVRQKRERAGSRPSMAGDLGPRRAYGPLVDDAVRIPGMIMRRSTPYPKSLARQAISQNTKFFYIDSAHDTAYDCMSF